jgi:hypothetical protein
LCTMAGGFAPSSGVSGALAMTAVTGALTSLPASRLEESMEILQEELERF